MGAATRKDTTSGAGENCRHLPVLFADIDFQNEKHPTAPTEEECRAALAGCPIAPSIVLHSGGGLYSFWLLREPIDLATDFDRAKDLLRRLAHAIGADLGAAEPARVLRLLGTLNHKYDPPRCVTCEVFDPERRVNLSELEEWLPAPPRETARAPQRAPIEGKVGPGKRNDHLTRRAGQIRRPGFSAAAMLAALTVVNTEECDPPLDAKEVAEIAASVSGYKPAGPDGATATPFKRTDAGNAELFAARHAADLRFDHAAQIWRIWNGHYWAADRDGTVRRLAKAAARARLDAATTITQDTERKDEVKWALQSESRRGLDALLSIAQSEKPIAVSGDEWNQHPMLLAVQNGVLDLERGVLRGGRPEDGITRAAPVTYDPDARCPRWDRFMREVFATHPEIADYLQRVLGYTLTGDTAEQALWIFHGIGANGKST